MFKQFSLIIQCWQPTRMKRMNHPNNPLSSWSPGWLGWKLCFHIFSFVFACCCCFVCHIFLVFFSLVTLTIGKNGSYQPPGAPETLQDLRIKPKTSVFEPDFLEKYREKISIFLINPFWGGPPWEAVNTALYQNTAKQNYRSCAVGRPGARPMERQTPVTHTNHKGVEVVATPHGVFT